MPRYDPQAIEYKWQERWEKAGAFRAHDTSHGEHSFVLDMFPYPSAQGLHVGHPLAYIATDIYSRYLRMKGVNVLHPMGWDAFGLPAENYAIKSGIHPRETTLKSIDNFRRQLQSLGFSYDWSREVSTADPAYYKWTQWLFLKLYEKGLAYRKEAPVNWCPNDQTVLANEQVVDGCCERCGAKVEQRQMKQWFFKTTVYADKLLAGLEGLDWPQPIIDMQRNWIGKSEGALVKFPLTHVPGQKDKKHAVEIFTTRLDTIFGATFVVISPELAQKWIDVGWQASEAVKKYVAKSLEGKELERLERTAKEKTGVDTGVKAINPATKEEVPVWVADYVLGSYGTGAIMAVPAHDERDFAFAKRYNLSIRRVIEPLFVDTTEQGKVREGVEFVERDAIMAVVKHWSEDKYIGLRWKKVDWRTLITGAPEKGQSPIEGAITEIIQETGYLHPKLIKNLSRVHSKFYHVPKKVNRLAHFDVLYFELTDDNRQEISEEEKAIHEVEWLTKEEMEKFLSPEAHKYSWRDFGGYPVYSGAGLLVGSGKFDGMDSETSKSEIAKFIGAELKTQYKLRDWLISRQRYWGAPIPIVYCEACGEVPVPEKDLPVELPDDVDFRPAGESPLARSKSFHNITCPKCGKPARRESDTMDTFVDSSWYFLRYCDPQNSKAAFDAKKVKRWAPVNLYVGGAEHAVLHLMYARFITKALQDLGYVDFPEPFLKLKNQGLILGEDGEKMSKSKGNVVNPDEVVEQYGADTLRLYEMFLGPLEDVKPWNTSSIIGVRRFLERVWKLCLDQNEQRNLIKSHESVEASAIKEITEDIEAFHFNTAISSLMIYSNALAEASLAQRTASVRTLLVLLYPFAPHLTAELWEQLKFGGQVWEQPWPKYNEAALKTETVTIAVQVNGKLRATIEVKPEASEDEVVAAARAMPQVAKYLVDGTITKTIYVSSKLVNFVIGS